MTDQLETKWSAEQLDEAELALKNTTPKEYLEFMEYVKSCEEQLPEAGCIIFSEFVSSIGTKYNATVRAVDPESAWKKMIRLTAIAAGYGIKANAPTPAPVATLPPAAVAVAAAMQAPLPGNNVPSQAPAPAQPAPAHVATPAASAIDMSKVVSLGVPNGESKGPFKVVEVSRILLQDNTTSKLQCFTAPGTWTARYGAPMYSEMMEMLGIHIDAYEIGKKYIPPAVIGYIWIEMKDDGKSVKKVYAVAPQ